MKIKLVTVFILTLFLTLGARAEDITFTVISGTCLQSDKTNNKMTPIIENLLTAKRDINKSNTRFVAFLGDNINRADNYDLVMFAKVINKISKPVYVGIGEHDVIKVKNVDKKSYYRLLNKFSKNKIKKVPSAKKINGYVFVFMDGVLEFVPGPNGNYKEGELIWLDNVLTKYENKKVIILQHFPVFSPTEGKEALGSDEYKKVLSKHNNVKAVISGHINFGDDFTDENGVKHMSLPALKDGKYKVINVKDNGNDIFIDTKTINVHS